MNAKAFNKWSFWAWIGPSLGVSYLFKDSVPWVVGMSWWAIVVSHLAAWRADEPNP